MRVELMDQAQHLARVLRKLMPDEREVRGLHALMLVTDARRDTRVDDSGRLLLLREQDRTRWDQEAIAESDILIVDALRGARPGRYDCSTSWPSSIGSNTRAGCTATSTFPQSRQISCNAWDGTPTRPAPISRLSI